MSEPFLAEIRIWANDFAPRGWSFCNGQLLPLSQNTALFSLVGTTYGGDGRTTVGLPNLEGSAPMHPGRGPGLTPRRLGERGGVTRVTLTELQTPQHFHTLRASEEDGNRRDAVGNSIARGTPMFVAPIPAPPLGAMAPATLPPVGGSGSHENMQPYLVLHFCIALVGIYPSRG